LHAIYNNLVITAYLINVGLGGLGEDAHLRLRFLNSAGLPKFRENSFTKV